MTAVSERDRIGGDELKKLELIRRAALKSFATRGAAATSLRSVAADAGVSLGLVQHHFETKAGLIKAVDDYVMSVVDCGRRAAGLSAAQRFGGRHGQQDHHSDQSSILRSSPTTLARSSTAAQLGITIFDTLAAFGTARWNQRKDNGEVREDIDLTWATLNSLVLALGTLILRSHIERQVPDAFSTPAGLQRWQDSVTTLLREGLFLPQAGDTGS